MNIFIIPVLHNSVISNNSYDVRFDIITKIYKYLLNKHTIYYPERHKHILPNELKKKSILFNFDKHKDIIDFMIIWGPLIYKFSATEKIYNDMYYLMKNNNKPVICYEHGWLFDSMFIDKEKMFGDAYYANTINLEINKNYNNIEAEEYRNKLILNNKSKRPQNNLNEKYNNYIFLPCQKIEDLSITKYSNIGMIDFVNKVLAFAEKNNILVVTKFHPHAIKDIPILHNVINNNKYKNVKISTNNIFTLCKNALFTVCINSGSIIDNIITLSPVYCCGKSIFYKSGAIIYNENIEEGLNTMLNKTYDNELLKNNQLKMLWWLKNNLLFKHNSITENLKLIENESNLEF